MTTAAEPQLSQAAQEPAQLHHPTPLPAAVFTPSAPAAAAAKSATTPTAHTSAQINQPHHQPVQEPAQANIYPAAAITPISTAQKSALSTTQMDNNDAYLEPARLNTNNTYPE